MSFFLPSWRGTDFKMENEYVHEWYKDKPSIRPPRPPCEPEFWVGLQYYLGQGKPHDEEKAINLWKIAANAGQLFPQIALADLYYQDDNTDWLPHHCKKCDIERDLIKAYFWYKLAWFNSNYKSVPSPHRAYIELMLRAIETEMTKEDIDKGYRLVNSWRSNIKDCKPKDFWD